MKTIPDATTIAFFRERLCKAGVILELFERFEEHLSSKGLEARGGQIIDATLVPVPRQRDSREENKTIKAGQLPEGWSDKPEQLRQKDLDALWVKKHGISHYGFKNSICIDARHGFIRRFAITPANIHDSQMLPQVLDPENSDDFVWAESGYAWARSEDLLDLAGFESRIHEKGARSHPLSEQAQERHKMRSKVRARVEHVFGLITTCMRGKLTRLIGLAGTRAWWRLRILTYNFLRYLHSNEKQRWLSDHASGAK
ncbi:MULTISPECIES: IS5 family transposase [unclassified Synechococcus]|uniref:IS5 family transposase n=1 Tax=unclassified Synechococcus TaxID=2626047 RepID=UPI0020CDBCB0|nr:MULTISPECIES: IS5 family transposase [unclassified Synechococcus]